MIYLPRVTIQEHKVTSLHISLSVIRAWTCKKTQNAKQFSATNFIRVTWLTASTENVLNIVWHLSQGAECVTERAERVTERAERVSAKVKVGYEEV